MNVSHNKPPIRLSSVDYSWRSAVQTTFTHFVAHPPNPYLPNLATRMSLKKKLKIKTPTKLGTASKILLNQTNKPKTKSSEEWAHARLL